MCKYKSAWYLESGELVHSISTDAHGQIAAARGIQDRMIGMNRAVRVEFVPPKDVNDITDLDKWTLRLDEATAPDWWEDKKADCLRQIGAVVKNSIVMDERECLLDGCWILTNTAIVHAIIGGRVISAAGANLRNANLENAYLENANLGYANLGYANLVNAYLVNAYLYNANLRNANLVDANLVDANLGYANLENARRLPDDKPIPGWQIVNDVLQKM